MMHNCRFLAPTNTVFYTVYLSFSREEVMAVAIINSGFSLKFSKPRVSLPISRAVSISETFLRLRQRGNVALIPYITAGDPDLSTTAEALKVLDYCGSDVIELGIPFTDPFLDGPVIQAACRRSLAGGANLESIFSMLKVVAPQLSCPVSLFTYYYLIQKRGIGLFMADANDAGVRGLIVPDIPLEYTKTLRVEGLKYGIEIILLTTPTTPTVRMKSIVEVAQGFVYLVSSVGVTGPRPSVNPRIEQLLQEIKKVTNKPVAVGFGISKPEHVRQIARWGADGVIVGSAMVKLLGEAKTAEEGLKELQVFTKSLKMALSDNLYECDPTSEAHSLIGEAQQTKLTPVSCCLKN